MAETRSDTQRIDSAFATAEVTVDFGSSGAEQLIVTVNDSTVSASSHIIAAMAYKAAGSRDLDECEMDSFSVRAGNIVAGVSYDLLITCLTGTAEGQYLVNVWRN